MKPTAWLGVILVIVGVAGLAVHDFSYTTQENVVDFGPIHATADKVHDIVIQPAAAIAVIIIGGLLVVFGRKRT